MVFRQLEALPETNHRQLELLRVKIKTLKKVCVAYSGGVDSTLVAAISFEQLGSNAMAITGISSALAPHLRLEAKNQAKWIGITHQECLTNELANPTYSKNSQDRCFACKQELHTKVAEISRLKKGVQVIDGVNQDDLSDFRPGIKAAKQAGVISPLADLGINKEAIRLISKALGFPWWDKPAQPCLSSRFPYGEAIDEKRLRQVGEAENWLRINGYKEVRVRIEGLGAKIEVPKEHIKGLILTIGAENIFKKFKDIGFSSVTLDLEGLISGKLNRIINSKK